jgi:antitoxin component of MazEF toxin-antitoxin module
MQAKIEKVGDGFGLILPKDLLDACGIGEEATVIVQNRTLIVAAQDWRPRQGWEEALKRAAASAADEGEDEETLAHWASLPAAAEPPQPEPNPVPEAVLREEPTPYGNRQDQGGA